MGWDRHELLWNGMEQKNMSHGQAWITPKQRVPAMPRERSRGKQVGAAYQEKDEPCGKFSYSFTVATINA